MHQLKFNSSPHKKNITVSNRLKGKKEIPPADLSKFTELKIYPPIMAEEDVIAEADRRKKRRDSSRRASMEIATLRDDYKKLYDRYQEAIVQFRRLEKERQSYFDDICKLREEVKYLSKENEIVAEEYNALGLSPKRLTPTNSGSIGTPKEAPGSPPYK